MRGRDLCLAVEEIHGYPRGKAERKREEREGETSGRDDRGRERKRDPKSNEFMLDQRLPLRTKKK